MFGLGPRARTVGAWIALATALVVTGACSSGSGRAALTTVPPATTSTTTPLSQVPATIDVPYVQRVMDALDHLTGEAAREFVAHRGPTPRFEQIIEAVYAKSALDDITSFFGRAAAQANLSPVNLSPQDPSTSVQRVITATPTCFVFEASDDLRPMLANPPAAGAADSIFQLTKKDLATDQAHINPTPWVIDLSGQKSAVTLGDKPCG